jgi:hypothetical protein
MIRISFTAEEVAALRYESFNHPHPRVQLKMTALLLKSFDLPHETIAAVLNICENTLRTYLNTYKQGGIEKLKELNYEGGEGVLHKNQDMLESFFGIIHRPAWRKPQVKLNV